MHILFLSSPLYCKSMTIKATLLVSMQQPQHLASFFFYDSPTTPGAVPVFKIIDVFTAMCSYCSTEAITIRAEWDTNHCQIFSPFLLSCTGMLDTLQLYLSYFYYFAAWMTQKVELFIVRCIAQQLHSLSKHLPGVTRFGRKKKTCMLSDLFPTVQLLVNVIPTCFCLHILCAYAYIYDTTTKLYMK